MAEDDGTIYMPSKSEYIFTGTVGICVYSLILYLSIASAWVGFKSKSTRRFFGSIGIMALLELPRYFDMAVDGTYNSRVCYSFHIVAGVFFFLAFSIVCRQWSGLLQLGSYSRMVYGYNGLVISNVSFAIADFIAIIFCLTSRSLDGFFFSMAFVVITFIEGLRNCVYSGFLSYYGLKLVRRFWHFSRLERQVSRRYCCYIADDQVFTRVVLRLTSVLVLTTLCFLCRMTMLVAKMAELHSPKELTTPAFTLFGFWWFVFSDFLPRALPSLAFIFLMRTKRPAREQVHNGLHHTDRSQDRNTFQFVRLEAGGGGGGGGKGRGAGRESGEGRRGGGARGGGGEDDEEEDDDDRRDDFPRSYSFSGYSDDGMAEIHFQHPHDGDDDDATKSILHHDRFVSDEHAAHRPVSTEGFSLVSFRDLTRASPSASIGHPAVSSSSTIHRLESLQYLSDDEADYETVVAAGDDDEDDDEDGDTAGDKAIDSLLNLLSFTATGGGTSKAGSVGGGGGAQSRSGSYSGDAVAVAAGLAGPASGGGGGFTPSPSTSLPYHSSLSAASLAANVSSSSQSHRTDSSAVPGGDGSVAAMSSSSPATRSGPRGLGAAIQRMREQQQQQQQQQSPLQLPPPPPPAHTIEMHPDDSEQDEQDALV